jgi:hypothetical protein
MDINLDYETAAMECARYIFDSDCEQASYQNYVEEGNDPRDHIFYCAAVVLGETEDLQIEINEYLKQE